MEVLQDVDTIQISEADQRLIPELRLGDPELRLARIRLTFHRELLRWPPIQGKSPYQDFQLRDILRSINRNRYGLFLDMGLGKAYIAAAIIAHLRYYNLADKVLLISSNIGAANMVHELKKFIVDLDPNEIACLTKISRVKKEDREIFKPENRVIITNYSTFRHLSDHYAKKEGKTKGYRSAPIPIEEWLGGQPGILLLDESHALGNPSSLQTKKIMMHTGFFAYRYEFTGTPADKPEKLYAQLKILDKALVHNLSYQDWCVEYNEVGNGWSSYAINPQGWKHDKLKALNERLVKDYVIFRKGDDCLELPPNIIKKLYTRLDTKHRSIYQSFVRTTLDHIRESTGHLGTRDIMNAFPYMQMSLDNPHLLLTHSQILGPELSKIVEGFNFEKDSTKVEMLSDILQEKVDEQGERGIIWIYHPDTAHKLMKIYEKYNPLYIVGEIDDQERMPIIEKFKAQTEHKILIAGIPVLNTSVTITEATFQVYFERVYNFAQYWQSMARIHRIGQTKTTVTYVLIYDESIDVALDINLSNKDILNSKILSKEFLSLNEWKKIFNAVDTGNDTFDW
jgi:SNF2 family DNA or RNA helicase